MKKKTLSKRKPRAKKITLDVDHSTAVLLGSLAQKGIITLKHDGKLGYNKAKLDMTSDPKDKKVTLRANLNLAESYGFPHGH